MFLVLSCLGRLVSFVNAWIHRTLRMATGCSGVAMYSFAMFPAADYDMVIRGVRIVSSKPQ